MKRYYPLTARFTMNEIENNQNNCQIVFEVSNEIANKIGGIYSVIASKAPEIQRMLGPGNYLAIGLYNSFKAKNDFEELVVPSDFEEAFNILRVEGIDVKYGRWIGGGGVETILVDPSYLLDVPLITGNNERKVDQIKGMLWNWFNIDSLWMSEVFDPMITFGWAAGVLISHLVNISRYKGKKIVAHFHEWISGPGLLYLKKKNINVATIFMTHATQIGRNIAMGEEDINEILDTLLLKSETIPPQKAYQYHIEGTHQLEVACAKAADVLVTVSEAVARETEGILGKRADFIIPNGINFDLLAKKEDLNIKHLNARVKIARFVEAYFTPYYNIDFQNLMVVHISGRYEYHNKGIDVFIEALKIVNETLKQEHSTREILAFIWIPALVSGIKPFIINSFKIARQYRELIHSPLIRIEDWLLQISLNYSSHLKKQLIDFFTSNEIKEINELTKKNVSNELNERKPPICPFNLNEHDTIYQTLLQLDLTNNHKDKVKVIFYPIYLSKNDQLLELSYYDAVAGCDMGIYPSTYEPYGLTPLEALGLGVPSVTTDLSGFGLLVKDKPQKDVPGIFILKRKGRTNVEAAKDLARMIVDFSKLSEEQITKARLNAREIADLYSWQNIINEYKKVYDIALRKKINSG